MLIPVLERAATDGNGDFAALSRLQDDLLESAQLLDGHIDSGVVVAHIELDDLGASTVAGVLDGHGSRYGAIGSYLTLVEAQVAHGKGRVAQSMAKGKHRFLLLLVGPAVAHVNAFLVLLVNDIVILTPGTGIGA